jgi:hypothetical protein
MSSSPETAFYTVQETLADYLEFTFQNATMSMPREKWVAISEKQYAAGNDAVSVRVSFPEIANVKDAADVDTPRFEDPRVYFYGGSTGSGGNSVAFHMEIIDYFQPTRKIFIIPDPTTPGNLLLETHSQIPFRWLLVLKEYCDDFSDAVVEILERPILRETIRSIPWVTLKKIISSHSRCMMEGSITFDNVPIGESGEKWATRNITDYVEVTREKRNKQTWAIEKYTQKQYTRGVLSETAMNILKKYGCRPETDGSANIVIENAHTLLWKHFLDAYWKQLDKAEGEWGDGRMRAYDKSSEPVAVGCYSSDYYDLQEWISKKMIDLKRDPDTFSYHCSKYLMGEELFIFKVFLKKNGVKCEIPRCYLS